MPMTSGNVPARPSGYPWPRGSGQLVIEQQSQSEGNPGDGTGFFYGATKDLPPVINPFRDKLWDIDDLWQDRASGSLAAGETFTMTCPIVLDNQLRLFSISANGGKGHNRFTLAFELPEIGYRYAQTISWLKSTLNTLTGSKNSLAFCAMGPAFNWSRDFVTNAMVFTDSRIVPIEGSQGGQGIIATARFSITAIDSLRDAGMNAQVIYPNLQGQALCSGPIVTIPA